MAWPARNQRWRHRLVSAARQRHAGEKHNDQITGGVSESAAIYLESQNSGGVAAAAKAKISATAAAAPARCARGANGIAAASAKISGIIWRSAKYQAGGGISVMAASASA